VGGAVGGLEVAFEAPPSEPGRAGPLRVEIFDRRLAAADGSGPVRLVDLDAAAFWWLPTALLAALLLASPVPWRDRVARFLPAQACLQAVLLALLAVVIWRESGQLSAADGSPALPQGLASIVTLAAPVVVWGLWMGQGISLGWKKRQMEM